VGPAYAQVAPAGKVWVEMADPLLTNYFVNFAVNYIDLARPQPARNAAHSAAGGRCRVATAGEVHGKVHDIVGRTA